jgi:hypothetical protein
MDAFRRHLGRGLLAAIVLAGLIAPGPASAAFAKLDAGKLTYTAISGEANDLTATYSSPGAAKLSETGHWGPYPILISGCGGVAKLVTCSGTSSLVLNTGDGDDKVAARNGTADRISCGSGNDSVIADPNDAVGADCETVDRGGTVAPTLPGTGTSGPATDPGGGAAGTTDPAVEGGSTGLGESNPYVNFTAPVIPRQTATVSRSGIASVRIVCPAEAGACKGTVALVLVKRAGGARARVMAVAARRVKQTKRVKLGSARFSAKAGEKPIVQIRLNRRGRRRVLRTRHTRCRLVVTTRGADGKVVTTTREITLRARRTAGRIKKKR